MTLFRSNGTRVPAAVEKMADDVKSGRMDRREFLAIASALRRLDSARLRHDRHGSAGAGIAQESKKGGTLRLAMPVKAQKDPRTYDWVELANVSRYLAGAAGEVYPRIHLRACAAGELGGQ